MPEQWAALELLAQTCSLLNGLVGQMTGLNPRVLMGSVRDSEGRCTVNGPGPARFDVISCVPAEHPRRPNAASLHDYVCGS